jgi:hypothetical protein
MVSIKHRAWVFSVPVWTCKILSGLYLLSLLFALTQFATAATDQQTNPWRSSSALSSTLRTAQAWVEPESFLAFNLDHSVIERLLKQELREDAGASEAILTLPLPDGSFSNFRFFESGVMAPELAAKLPEIRTFCGQAVSDPAVSVRFEVTPAGFHAQIISPDGVSYIEPYLRGNTNLHVSYFKRDYRAGGTDFQCLTACDDSKVVSKIGGSPSTSSLNGNLRVYRLACAATGEYTAYHGGTVGAGMAAIVTSVNRVNGIFESELGIRLVLVGNNNLIVYTNSGTDPYSDSNPSLLLSQNQANLDSVIGSANYDVGHVFGTGGGGLAAVGIVCISGLKAHGETGIYPPVGDGFWVDYVAHEIGHQFGASHTFNSTNSACNANRSASTAYEPGSGSTIMAYAGVCGSDNLQSYSSSYFHSVSFDQIMACVTTGPGSLGGTITVTGNRVPAIAAGTNFMIPAGTPFILTASGSDPDGDALTWCWEERDLGPAAALTAADNGSSPLFRSFTPSVSSSRIFPQSADILNNTVTAGERLPATNRTMTFRVTARDNRAGGGGLTSADVQVTVVGAAGPFRITVPTTAVSLSGVCTVTWDVAGTANAPIHTTNVNILLSIDGGVSFPIVLATNAPNNGSQTVLLPNLATSSARIKVQAANNIFFDISRSNFAILPVAIVQPPPVLSLRVSNALATVAWDSQPGKTYRVQFRDSFSADWSNVFPDITATNTTATAAYPIGPAAQRFYRILQLQ